MKKKSILFLVLLTLITTISFGQTKSTKEASIKFFSEIGGINATNSKISSEIDITSGQLIFTGRIEDFIFKNSLMQKHYNEEDMMNSAKYPNTKYVGHITNNNQVDYTKNGTYPVIVKGKLTIKGITKEMTARGKITIVNGKISASSTFSIDRHNYNVIGNEESVSQVLKLTVKAIYRL